MKKMGNFVLAGLLWGAAFYYLAVFLKEEFGPKK
jgi:hypothetical protein